jgi:hypothetical protein
VQPIDDTKLTRIATTRRAIVKTGVKLAYAAPLIAASYGLVDGAVAQAGCTCPAGSVAIPSSVITQLRRFGLNTLADYVSGKCVGCTNGAIVLPTGINLTTVCQKIGQSMPQVCPGSGNRIALKNQTCPTVLSV